MPPQPPSFADHFSGHAADYASARPTYPSELFDWLAEASPARGVAWDCATGNGQAALELAERFELVIATDGSGQQLANARPHPNVRYARSIAEATPLADASVDLCTVAQAAHWFDFDRFWPEARRVCRQRALVALWCYVMCRVDPRVDAVVDRLYGPILGEYWPSGRYHVETEYREIPVPLDELDAPTFEIRRSWTFDDMRNYIGSWSSSQRYRATHAEDAFDQVQSELRAAWGEGKRDVVWPIHLRIGRV